MFKKLIEPSIDIEMNLFSFISIVVTSIYGSVYMIINSISEIKEIIKMFS